jgi:hypothetical protein
VGVCHYWRSRSAFQKHWATADIFSKQVHGMAMGFKSGDLTFTAV